MDYRSMQTTHSTRKTDPETERLVVTRIAAGIRYTDISEETNVPVPTIKKIRKRNELLLVEVRKQNIKKEVVVVVSNLQKAHKLLAQRLDQALIGQEKIADRDLVNIAREMYHQAQDTAQAEESLAVSEAEALRIAEQNEAIRQAMAEGDDVKLLNVLCSTTEGR